MPTYYPDEEGSLTPPDEEDYGTSLPTQQQAIALDQSLSQSLPQSPAFSVPISSPGGPMGEASREYRAGRPGLFVQGGPTIPAGMIEVNGQLERSQAAPQPVPWWITAADEFKEQRRQEDFLRSLIAQMPKDQGTKAINRARQLQGQLQLQSDVKSGIPFRDALVKNASNLYSGSPASLTHLAALRPVPKPATGVRTFTDPTTGRIFYERSTGQVVPVPASPERASRGEVTPVDEYRAHQSNLRELRKDLRDTMKIGDKESLEQAKGIKDEIKAETDLMNQLRKTRSAQASSPESQTAPNVSNPKAIAANQLAEKLRAEHPEWAVDKLKQEVLKQLK